MQANGLIVDYHMRLPIHATEVQYSALSRPRRRDGERAAVQHVYCTPVRRAHTCMSTR